MRCGSVSCERGKGGGGEVRSVGGREGGWRWGLYNNLREGGDGGV